MQRADKICYLDFDGVLHDEEVYWQPKRGIYMKTPGRVLFEWLPILDELLAPHPDVKIVLSTSWVRARSFYFARKQLTPRLQERVIGATFHSQAYLGEFIRLPRGVQITDDVSRRGPKSWFAIDDDYTGWPDWCRHNLIQTDGARGVSDPKIQHAIQVMLERM